MNLTDTPLIDRLTHFLDATAYRSGIIAGNIANIDTPGYHARDLDFRSQLMSLTSTDAQPAPPLVATRGSRDSPSGPTETTSTWTAKDWRWARCSCNSRPAWR